MVSPLLDFVGFSAPGADYTVLAVLPISPSEGPPYVSSVSSSSSDPGFPARRPVFSDPLAVVRVLTRSFL